MRERTVVAAMLSLAVIASCGGGAPAATSAPSAAVATATPVPVKIKVAYSNITGDVLSAWTAQDAGIFKKNSLDVELVSIDGGSRAMTALLAGEVQIAELGGAECLSATAGGSKVTVVAVLSPVFPYLFMVAPEIKTPADLKGTKVGISSIGGSADIATRRALRDLGLEPDKDVILVPLGSHAQRTAALIAGAIQGGVDDPPNTALLQDKGFHSIYDLAGKKLAAPQTAVAAQTSWVTANRDTMQRFVDSTVEAIAYMRKNKAATVAIMRKYFGKSTEKGFDEAVDFYLNEVFVALPFPRPELFVETQAELAKANDKVKAIDVKAVVDPSFVQSAADRGVDKR